MKIGRPKQHTISEPARFSLPSYAATFVFPDDITALDLANVSRLMGRCTAIQAWFIQQTAAYGKELARYENLMDAHTASLFATERGIRFLNKNQKEDKLLEDERFRTITGRLRLLRAQKDEAEKMSIAYEKYAWALSREMSRRSSVRDSVYASS